MIELRAARTTLGSFVLGPLDLRVQERQHRLVIGPSGAGKSLLLRTLAGLHPLHSGSRHAPGGCAWVGQRAALFPHMNVRENVAFGLHCQRLPRSVVDERVTRLAERLHIAQWLHRKPMQLSVGQQQRVALARALAPRFQTLLLDEPFSALDRGARMELYALLEELRTELSLSIVHVTHDIDLFVHMSLPAVALVSGAMVQTGTLQSILAAPRDPALHAALGGLQSSKRLAALK